MASISQEEVLKNEREALGLSEGNPGSALSISGGGIRSATFALGVIQGLAKNNLLTFDYLSTVSGGGYIGSWLTAWKNRCGSIEKVSEELAKENSGTGPEVKEIEHLREYSNYLTPKVGVTSFDSWALVATVSRNMLLNWFVIVPFLMLMLFLPRLYAASLAFPEFYFFDLGLFADGTAYKSAELDALSENWIITIFLPASAVILFSIAQANLLRYLPALGGIYHEAKDYFLWVLLPLVLSVWCLDIWNNLHYIGSSYSKTEPFLYMAGIAASYVLTLVLALATGFKFKLSIIFAPLLSTLIPGGWAWVVYNKLLWEPGEEMVWFWAQYTTYSLPLVILGIAFGIMLLVGLSTHTMKETDREWLARANGGLMLFAIAWFLLSSAVLLAPLFLFALNAMFREIPITSLLSGIGIILGWYSSRSDQSKAKSTSGNMLVALSTFIFLIILVIVLTLFTNFIIQEAHGLITCSPSSVLFPCRSPDWELGFIWNNHEEIISTANPVILGLVVLGLLITSIITGRLVNTNVFSLQGMYKNRLVRAYLGASNVDRNPNLFSGFSDNDDLLLSELDPTSKPYHVVNLALNLVGGAKLQWQQRKAATFIASPLFCGSNLLGYRPSSKYGGVGGMSLGTAVATSGAAASPNMGYHSSPILTFVMTLFNARLGIWLGNPQNEKLSKQAGPHSALTSFVGEALGKTSEKGAYIYLSDGGHFENLALYEMIQRGCKDILVLDGGCDPNFSFEDLGNAIRKINIDFGIEIDFLPGEMNKLIARQSRCSLANIHYPSINGKPNIGRLIYVKPLLRHTESPSVLSYSCSHPAFPHESTSDQWFDESQTESYRRLGWTTIMEITEGFSGSSFKELFEFLKSKSCDSNEKQNSS